MRFYRESFLRCCRIEELDEGQITKALPVCREALENLIKAKSAYDNEFGIVYTFEIGVFLRGSIPRRFVLPSLISR